MPRGNKPVCLLLCLWPAALAAQTSGGDIARIVERLDRLEEENRAQAREIAELRAQLAAARARPDVEQRLDIQEHRVEEQAQTKMEASEKFPIRLTGMALFNTFLDSRQAGSAEYPTVAAPQPGARQAGATLRQTTVGLEFFGPRTVFGGAVHGSVFVDFAGGAGSLGQTVRLRTGSVEIDWKNRSILAGVEKPIFNPREPSSLAQVEVSPLTGTGNLWLWLPQVRVEQDIAFGRSSGLRARLGVLQTHETNPYDTTAFTGTLAPSRPALEGRFELFYNLDENRRLEFAPGFHASTTHVNGLSIPSSLYSFDWFFNPWRKLEFTGAFYSGQNVSNLGTGGINQGYEIYKRYAVPIESRGGWGQLTLHAASRVDLHLCAGQMDDNRARLGPGDIGKNLMYGVNLFYRLAPNVILAPEISQLRTMYLGQGVRINNHYDLALAYSF
jgi:hypothetical protein